jgi:hypothetical protein
MGFEDVKFKQQRKTMLNTIFSTKLDQERNCVVHGSWVPKAKPYIQRKVSENIYKEGISQ